MLVQNLQKVLQGFKDAERAFGGGGGDIGGARIGAGAGKGHRLGSSNTATDLLSMLQNAGNDLADSNQQRLNRIMDAFQNGNAAQNGQGVGGKNGQNVRDVFGGQQQTNVNPLFGGNGQHNKGTQRMGRFVVDDEKEHDDAWPIDQIGGLHNGRGRGHLGSVSRTSVGHLVEEEELSDDDDNIGYDQFADDDFTTIKKVLDPIGLSKYTDVLVANGIKSKSQLMAMDMEFVEIFIADKRDQEKFKKFVGK